MLTNITFCHGFCYGYKYCCIHKNIYLFVVQMILAKRALVFVKVYANKPIQIKR